MQNKRITSRQQEIMAFFRQTIAKRGLPPSMREICGHFGFRSPHAAQQHVRALQKKGLITFEPGRSRTIRILADHPDRQDLSLPFCGEIS